MTDFRGCCAVSGGFQILRSKILQTFQVSGSSELTLTKEEKIVGGLRLGNSNLTVFVDQTVYDGKKFFTCANSVTQAERLSNQKILTIGGNDRVSLYTNGVMSLSVQIPEGHRGTALSVSHDRKYFAIGCAEGSVYLVDTGNFNFRLVHTHASPVRSVHVVSEDHVVSGSDTGEVGNAEYFHRGRVTAIVGDRKFLSVGIDGKIKISDQTIDVGFPILGATLSEDGNFLLVCGPETQKVLHVSGFAPRLGLQDDLDESVDTPATEEEKQDSSTVQMLYGDF